MRILILDDNAARHNAFDYVFARDHDVVHAWSYWDAVGLLESGGIDVAYLDHDLNGDNGGSRELTGADVARFIARCLRAAFRPQEVIVHSWNPGGASLMVNILRESGIKSSYRPFVSPDGMDFSEEL